MGMTLDRYLLIINIAGFILFGINTLLYTFTEEGQIDKVLTLVAIAELKDAGFVNITLDPKYDLIKGWLKKEGRVASVTVNGDSSFKANTSYRPDVEIVIVYHAFKKDKKD